MATVTGGLFDSAIQPTVTKAEATDLSTFLDTLGIPESSFTTVTVTVTGGAQVYQNTSSKESTNVIVNATNVTTTVTLGGSAADIGLTTGTGTVGVQSTPTVTTAGGVQTLADTIATDRIPDTNVGQQLKSTLSAIISDATASISGGAASLAVLDILGADSTSTMSFKNTSINSPVAVFNAGTSGATINVEGYNDIVTTGDSKLVISGNTNTDIRLFSGNTTVVGGGGNDSIIASYGSHTVSGGAGADSFGIRGSFLSNSNFLPQQTLLTEGGVTKSSEAAVSPVHIKTNLVISDFSIAQGDKLNFIYEGIDNFAEFKASLATAKQIGGDVVATTRDGDTITLTGVNLTALTTDMFTFG